MEVDRADPGLLPLGPKEPFHRPARLTGNPAGPIRVGIAELGGQRRAGAAPAEQRRRPSGLAGLPAKGRSALRARRYLLDEHVPPAVRDERQADADPFLADL